MNEPRTLLRPAVLWTLLHVSLALMLAVVGAFLLVVFGGMSPSWFAPADDAAALPSTPTTRLRQRLTTPETFDARTASGNNTLRDVLEYFGDRHGIDFIIDARAFAQIGCEKVAEQPVNLPCVEGMELGTLLRLILKQIAGGNAHGTYLVQGNHVLITTTAHTSISNWSKADFRPPLVSLDCEQTPLREVVQALADQSGINIILDARRAARKLLTVQCQETRVDHAARLVAHLAGLETVLLDNVIYLTDPEQARRLQAEAAVAASATAASRPDRPKNP